jgi:hypothetical protein
VPNHLAIPAKKEIQLLNLKMGGSMSPKLPFKIMKAEIKQK